MLARCCRHSAEPLRLSPAGRSSPTPGSRIQLFTIQSQQHQPLPYWLFIILLGTLDDSDLVYHATIPSCLLFLLHFSPKDNLVMYLIIYFAEENLRCWGDWVEDDYHFIVLSSKGVDKSAEYILVSQQNASAIVVYLFMSVCK